MNNKVSLPRTRYGSLSPPDREFWYQIRYNLALYQDHRLSHLRGEPLSPAAAAATARGTTLLEHLYRHQYIFVFSLPPLGVEGRHLLQRGDTVSQIPAHQHNIRARWDSEREARNMRNEQRYAICAGFWHNYLPNDLTRWVSAYAVPRSKVYAYMK